MENNLYYTPTIEEFHVGFEYEHLTGFEKEFKFYIYDLAKACLIIERESISHNGEIVKMFIPAIQACIEEKQCRVKYLDQSDIESLGWDHDQTTKDGACFYYGTLMSTKQYILNCPEARKDNYINLEITDVTSLQNTTQLFDGTIKNKSELIKLMQQLNIK